MSIPEGFKRVPVRFNRGVGCPTKLTPELKEKLLTYIRAGSYRNAACAAVGIGRSTLYEWEDNAAAGREPYKSFCEELAIAEGEAEARLTMLVSAAAGGKAPEGAEWKAGAFLLERRFRRNWTQQQQIEVSAGGGAESPERAREIMRHEFVGETVPVAFELGEDDAPGPEDGATQH